MQFLCTPQTTATNTATTQSECHRTPAHPQPHAFDHASRCSAYALHNSPPTRSKCTRCAYRPDHLVFPADTHSAMCSINDHSRARIAARDSFCSYSVGWQVARTPAACSLRRARMTIGELAARNETRVWQPVVALVALVIDDTDASRIAPAARIIGNTCFAVAVDLTRIVCSR